MLPVLHTLSSTKKEEFDLGQFWSLESMGILPGAEKGVHAVFLENYLNTSITRNSDGSYTEKFPWKEDAPPLPSNYSSCTRRTRAMVRRLADTPHLLETYADIHKEMER